MPFPWIRSWPRSSVAKIAAAFSSNLGLEDVRLVGGCDSGYSCAYSNTVSWSGPSTPLPYETNPRAVFERLFGDGETTDPAVRAMRSREDRSILDFVDGGCGPTRDQSSEQTIAAK